MPRATEGSTGSSRSLVFGVNVVLNVGNGSEYGGGAGTMVQAGSTVNWAVFFFWGAWYKEEGGEEACAPCERSRESQH